MDATHSAVFHQVEGLCLGENIGLTDLLGTLEAFIRRLFGPDRKVRVRSSYFPFTEPSIEVDMDCILCAAKGCPVCKKSGWLEILGAGMVHPRLFRLAGYDGRGERIRVRHGCRAPDDAALRYQRPSPVL